MTGAGAKPRAAAVRAAAADLVPAAVVVAVPGHHPAAAAAAHGPAVRRMTRSSTTAAGTAEPSTLAVPVSEADRQGRGRQGPGPVQLLTRQAVDRRQGEQRRQTPAAELPMELRMIRRVVGLELNREEREQLQVQMEHQAILQPVQNLIPMESIVQTISPEE